jgi:carboxyl-terminal processing protease
MHFDDDTNGSSGTPPEDAAAGAGHDAEPAGPPPAPTGEPDSGQAADFADQALTSFTPPAPPSAPTPDQPSPWQPLPSSGWNAAGPWQSGSPQSGPNPWSTPAPSPLPSPAPAPVQPPTWQPGQNWQPAQPSWQPVQPVQPSWQSGPPAGDVTSRRPSRLPQILGIVAACLLAFSGGLLTDHYGFPASSTCAPQAQKTPAAAGSSAATSTQACTAAGAIGSNSGSSLYDQALQIIKQNYVGRSSVTDQQLLYGSIKGMVDSLGDTGHSTFLTPQEYAAFQASLGDTVAGIGVMLNDNAGVFTVTKVLTGSPAETAGVKAGDIITAVDGATTTGMSFDVLTTKIRGAAGTKVTITVIHLGSTAPVSIAITRANLTVPLAEWGIVPGTHVADIALAEFSTGAADQLWTDITAAKAAGATSMVLDLRGNPGGYAAEAQEVASEFMSSGTVYIQQDANGKNASVTVDTARAHTSLPLVVLVDHDSASSSEIVAGALQDSHRALKIVGVPTYGTGTVLQAFPLSDGSVIILGTSWWLTPAGHRIFGVGITPDQTVQMPTGIFPVDPSTFTSMTAAQFTASQDAQLQAAVNDLPK